MYRNVKDRDLARWEGRFMAEGEHLVRRLLASDFKAESLMLVGRLVAEIEPIVPDDLPAYVVSVEVMQQITGMKFHGGILAVGVRKPAKTLEEVVPRHTDRLTLVICPDVHNVENLGSLIRLSAGFGADAMILGERCHDPFWRLSVRVSMGAIFSLPIYQSPDLNRDLLRLRDEWGVELVATVLDTDAEPLKRAQRAARLGLLLGNEAQGLERQTVALCQRRVTIPMHRSTDSLNVAIAGGIFLYHFTG